ncbi:MAG: MFS transporter [Clostridium sp.]|nr:MFS transporter [Clostridium sp.]
MKTAKSFTMKNNLKNNNVTYKDILHQKEYLKIILAGLINRFGDSIDAIAFTWLVYAITKSALWSALIFAVNQLPSVLLQPFAGALVEGMEKKKVMVSTDIIRGVTTLLLALLYLLGYLTPWAMLLFTLINSSAEAFRLPAGLAVTPKILDEKYYTYGTALNTTLSTAMQLIGLGAAGIIISVFGIGCAIAIDGASFFGSAFILSFLHIHESNLRQGKLRIKEYLSTLKDGLFYLKAAPVIRNFCLLAVLLNAVFTPLNCLQSPLVYEVLGGGSELLSLLSFSTTAGVGVGSFLYPFFADKLPVRMKFATFGILIGIVLYSYTFGEKYKSHTIFIYGLTIGVSFLFGLCVSILSSTLSVHFMKTVQPEYLARVGSIFNAGACAATPLVSFAVSAFTPFYSISQIIRISGILCVIIFAMIALMRIRLE